MSKLETPFEADPTSSFEEQRRLRRLRMIVDLTCNVLTTDPNLNIRQAMSLVTCARKAILEMLPAYEENFDTRIRPRFERIIFGRWPLEISSHARSQELVN